MGNSLSPAQEQHVTELQTLLHKAQHPVSLQKVRELVQAIAERCSWYPKQGNFKISDWHQIGEALHSEPQAPITVLQTWHFCLHAIQLHASQLKSQKEASMLSPPSTPTRISLFEMPACMSPPLFFPYIPAPLPCIPVPQTVPAGSSTIVEKTMAQESNCSEDLKVEVRSCPLICPVIVEQDTQSQVTCFTPLSSAKVLGKTNFTESAEIDLIIQKELAFPLPEKVQIITPQVRGPLPLDEVNFVLPQSPTRARGICAVLEIHDSDYKEVLKVQLFKIFLEEPVNYACCLLAATLQQNFMTLHSRPPDVWAAYCPRTKFKSDPFFDILQSQKTVVS